MHGYKQLFLSATFLTLSFFCSRKSAAQEINLQRDEALREQVFQQIVSDQQLFESLMTEVKEDEQSMRWMMSDKEIIRGAYREKVMERMMKSNPNMQVQVMENMVSMMQKDSTMLLRMQNMMMDNPATRQQMMQNMVNRMNKSPEMYYQMKNMMQRHRARGMHVRD